MGRQIGDFQGMVLLTVSATRSMGSIYRGPLFPVGVAVPVGPVHGLLGEPFNGYRRRSGRPERPGARNRSLRRARKASMC